MAVPFIRNFVNTICPISKIFGKLERETLNPVKNNITVFRFLRHFIE